MRCHRPVSWQSSVLRTPVALPPILEWMEQRMPERRPFIQTTSLEERLAKEAKQLRKQAQGTAPGIERDLLIRKARRAETAATAGRVGAQHVLNAEYFKRIDALNYTMSNSQGGVSAKYHCFSEFSFDERNLGDLGLRI
jgi:hypothetical protein